MILVDHSHQMQHVIVILIHAVTRVLVVLLVFVYKPIITDVNVEVVIGWVKTYHATQHTMILMLFLKVVAILVTKKMPTMVVLQLMVQAVGEEPTMVDLKPVVLVTIQKLGG
jgi:hypothetical protein